MTDAFDIDTFLENKIAAAPDGTPFAKQLVIGGKLITPKEYSLLPQALAKSYAFGCNAPAFDDQRVEDITVANFDGLLIVYFFNDHNELQYVFPRGFRPPFTESLVWNSDIRYNTRIPFTSLVKTLSIALGIVERSGRECVDISRVVRGYDLLEDLMLQPTARLQAGVTYTAQKFLVLKQ